MRNKKVVARLAAAGILSAVGLFAGLVFATDYDYTGKIGRIHVRADYDEIMFAGSPNVCSGDVPASWRGRVRLYRSHPGYETVASSGVLSASVLGAGGTVTMTGTNRWNQEVVAATGAATVSDSEWTAIILASL